MKLFNKVTAWLAVALLSGTGLALADPPSIVGRLNYLSGTVSFAPADASNDWGVAPLNRPVTTGDRLWADRDGRAEMRIGSTAIRIAALTSVDVLRLDDEGTQLRLAQGTLNVHLRKLDSGDSFEISTPDGAVLLTQPGNYRINVDPSGATTTVVVRRGQADVLTGNTPFLVRDNQRASFSAQQQELVGAPAPDEFDNWALARDRQEERIVATRYVTPEMTGYEDLDQHGAWQTASQYGNVWVPTAVPAGWAPYRDGRWVWISPWGWTWVDNAPWGFAPYHYGRWVWLGHRWGWAPGARVARPVYAPALVAFVGGSNWSVGVGSGPAVGWVPLGWREPYIPWYRHSPTYARNVNVTHVTNVTVIQQYSNNDRRIRYVNRDVPSGTTVVTRDTFVRARQVSEAPLRVPAQALAAARVTHDAPVSRPERQSLVSSRPGTRLPAAIESREVVAQRAPASPARLQAEGAAGNERGGAAEQRSRVRVLTAEQANAPRRAPDTPAPPAAAQGEKRERTAEPSPQATRPKPRAEKPVPQPPAQDERRERAAAPPSTQPNPRGEQNQPPQATRGERRERAAEPPAGAAPPKPRVEQNQPPQAVQGERRERAEQPTVAAPPKPRMEQPPSPQPAPGQRREQAAEQSPPPASPAPPKARVAEPASPPAAPRAAAPPPAVDARQQQERQLQQEQQRQARAQAQQQQQQEQRERQQQVQQQRAQETQQQQQRDRQVQQAQQDPQRQAARAQAQEQQREHQQQMQQQRAQETQQRQQRDQQMQQQQAQQADQQRQAQRQQAEQQRQQQREQRQANPPPAQAPPAQPARRAPAPDGERPPQSR